MRGKGASRRYMRRPLLAMIHERALTQSEHKNKNKIYIAGLKRFIGTHGPKPSIRPFWTPKAGTPIFTSTGPGWPGPAPWSGISSVSV